MRFLITSWLLFVSSAAFSQSSVKTDSSLPDSSGWSNTFIGLSLNTTYRSEHPLIFAPAASLRIGHFYSSLRYNFEASKTFSVAAGYQFFAGDNTWIVATPLLGVSVGNYEAFNPELLLLFGTGNFILAADGEVSFPFDDSLRKSVLLWTGIYYNITPWLYTGVSVQKTRLFGPENNLDAGILLGVMRGNFDISFQATRFWEPKGYYQLSVSYYMNPQKSDRRHSTVTPGGNSAAPKN